jgi:Repeat of unknown function (DUF5648)
MNKAAFALLALFAVGLHQEIAIAQSRFKATAEVGRGGVIVAGVEYDFDVAIVGQRGVYLLPKDHTGAGGFDVSFAAVSKLFASPPPRDGEPELLTNEARNGILVPAVSTLLMVDASRRSPDQPKNPSLLAKATEFYNAALDRYFITTDESEARALSANPNTGEQETGKAFYVPLAERTVILGLGDLGVGYEYDRPVCRFYGSQRPGPNSHFFTINSEECDYLKRLQATTSAEQPRWNYEGIAFLARRPLFPTAEPPGTAVCFGTGRPLYRSYNRGNERNKDSNHRFVTEKAEHEKMIAKGWKDEGAVMCVE